jgi:hypothetical protein
MDRLNLAVQRRQQRDIGGPGAADDDLGLDAGWHLNVSCRQGVRLSAGLAEGGYCSECIAY